MKTITCTCGLEMEIVSEGKARCPDCGLFHIGRQMEEITPDTASTGGLTADQVWDIYRL